MPAETTNRPIPQQETQGIRSAGFDSSSESDGAATFRSILFGGDADDASAVNQSAPEYFRDLNLDQIVESITVGRDEYDLRPIFHAPLATIDAIHYRQAVFRDLDVPALLDQLQSFARAVRQMRSCVGKSRKVLLQSPKECSHPERRRSLLCCRVAAEWNGNVQFAMPGKPYDQLSTTTLAQYGCTPGAPTGNCQLLNQVTNPFNGVIGPGTIYSVASSGLTSSSTVEMGQLLKQWPQYQNVSSFRKPGAASMYNAFTLRADKNFTHGLTFTFSFTDGREYDNAASPVNYLGTGSQTYADQYNPKAEWGIGAQNISYDVESSFLYQLPFGHGQPFLNHGGAVGDKLVNGWQITGIENWSSGAPIVLNSMDNGTTKNALWGGNVH